MATIVHNGVMGRYSKSTDQLERAEQSIPLGSQTFSKSKIQYPVGISPLYASKTKGAEIWDIDGNRYIDLVSALASVTLGYGDKGVEKAVRRQLKLGVNMSLPGILESEVAELLIEMVPSAEMVRFGKNGTDATSAAIRLARAYTGRDHIIVCGYHGWQDWYIGSTTRNKGVPISVSVLTHKFEYNNIASLKEILGKFEGKIAAVIMEPMNIAYPEPEFLESVQQLTHDAGALLVFDETITGFRFARGGAQELFGVIPDLSTFGKGMANGFPLSAVVGRRDVMMEMEEIFFSGTFGGELLSLAAAKEVLSRHLESDIIAEIHNSGEFLRSKVSAIISQVGLGEILELTGHPSWVFLNWKRTTNYTQEEIKTYFMQEMFKNNVLILNSHNINLGHTNHNLKKVVNAYQEVLSKLQTRIVSQDLLEYTNGHTIKSIFKVR